MTDEQVKIADEFLNYINERKGYCSNADLYEYLHNDQNSHLDVEFVTKTLMTQNLFFQESVLTTLTPEGFQAAKSGYKKYSAALINKEALYQDSLKATVISAKWNRIYAIAAITISLAAIVISIISLIKQPG